MNRKRRPRKPGTIMELLRKELLRMNRDYGFGAGIAYDLLAELRAALKASRP